MAYSIAYTDEPRKGSIVVEDNTLNVQTSLTFPGRRYEGYGKYIAENFLHLLENFASIGEPSRPSEGQLWYDVDDEQLKVFDGSNWIPAGGLNKGNNEPDVDNTKDGDLWVDTDNKQLYVRSNDDWLLIGPDFSGGLSTGASPRQIVGTDNVTYSVTVVEVDAETVAIFSGSTFTPKSSISGFNTIRSGINIPGSGFGSDKIPRYYGVSETADSLLINNEKIQSANFLRGDTTSTTLFPLNIQNNTGMIIGSDAALNLGVEGQAGLIEHQIEGSNIDVRIKKDGASQTVLRIDSSRRLGINNEAPDEALDVIGSVKIQPDPQQSNTGVLQISTTTDSTDIDKGSVTTKGGVGIAKNLNVGGSATFKHTNFGGSAVPTQTNLYNLGSSDTRWNEVNAREFRGDTFRGTVVGNVSGEAGLARQLAEQTTFRISGDLESDPVLFDGQTGGTTKTFDVTLKNSVVGSRNRLQSTLSTDEFLVNRVEGEEVGLFKASRQAILNAVPVNPAGVVMPYVGDVAPPGWKFCDGQEYRQADYTELFSVIGFKFGGESTVRAGYFRVPDFRGRLPLGADNMGGNQAGVVTSSYADTVGATGGSQNTNIELENLPDHEHDLRSDDSDQFYAIRNQSGTPDDVDAESFDAPTDFGNAQGLTNSGGVVQPDDGLGNPVDIMNPTLTMNYIIYMGRDD